MRPNEFLTHDGAATGAHALGCQSSSCRSVRGGDCMTSDVDKVEREDPDNPGYLGEDRVRRDVGDLGSWVCPPWLARDETPGP